jgi:hypothetical protein
MKNLPERCPKCDAVYVRVELSETAHVNGLRFERRVYACGNTFELIPNYPTDPVLGKGECRRSKEYVAKIAKRRALIESLCEVLDKSDADKEFVEGMRQNLPAYY